MPYVYSRGVVLRARAFEALAYVGLKILGRMRRHKNASATDPLNILLVEPFQMGDVISLSVMLDPLKALWPDSTVTVLTQPKNEHVFKYDSRVSRTIVCPFPWSQKGRLHKVVDWLSMWRALSALRQAGGFDVGMDTRGEIRNQLLMVLCGCRRRIGYTNYMTSNMRIRGLFLTDNLGEAPLMHRYDINRWVVEKALGVTFPELAFPTFRADGIVPLRLYPGKKQIVVHPGGGWSFRLWSNERWVEVINTLGTNSTLGIVLIGGENERNVVSSISSCLRVPHEKRITSFEELVGLLKGTDLFVGLDSGPMNLAVTLGVRALALFGPGDHELWYPHGRRDIFLHARNSFPCNPCMQRKCVVPEASCMTQIKAQDVLEQVTAMLA